VAGARLAPGEVLIAPGNYHLRVRRVAGRVQASLDQGTPENYCRPAVDVLFRSAAAAVGGSVLGVVLTGMGADGAKGSRNIVDRGGAVLAQDQHSSVVWGMPGAVANAGLAELVLPLGDLPAEITRRLVHPHVGGSASNRMNNAVVGGAR
jgi:two-component system chemotaxis response regulator CheB